MNICSCICPIVPLLPQPVKHPPLLRVTKVLWKRLIGSARLRSGTSQHGSWRCRAGSAHLVPGMGLILERGTVGVQKRQSLPRHLCRGGDRGPLLPMSHGPAAGSMVEFARLAHRRLPPLCPAGHFLWVRPRDFLRWAGFYVNLASFTEIGRGRRLTPAQLMLSLSGVRYGRWPVP